MTIHGALIGSACIETTSPAKDALEKRSLPPSPTTAAATPTATLTATANTKSAANENKTKSPKTNPTKPASKKRKLLPTT